MSFLDTGDAKVHYQVLGAGERTVVFLHGLVMDNLSSWFFTMANPVSRFARVVLYDLRGHGFSDRPEGDYGIGRHLRDLEALLDSLGATEPVTLVGNSFGGLLALNFARTRPERVRDLILVDAQINDAEWARQMAASLRLDGAERDRLIVDTFQNWLGRSSRRKSNRLAQNADALVNGTSLVSDLQSSELIGDEELRGIHAETLAIYGERSDIISSAHRLEACLPGCSLHVLEGGTHSVLWEKTDHVKALILERLSAGSV